MDPIRVFIGTEIKTRVAEKVLIHSIKSRTTRLVEFTPMIGPGWEYPIDGIKVGTGFSLRRWMIPAACGFKGYAIYLDADQIVLGDIAELWDTGRALMPSVDRDERVVACTFQRDKSYPNRDAPQTSVMVVNCELVDGCWQFDISKILQWLKDNPGPERYAHFMHAQDLRVAALPTEWNHLNVYQEGKTKLLHYTSESSQPWYKPDHPLAYLWKKELSAALKAGAVTRADLEEALAMWGKKADWRPTNGLHPAYMKWLKEAIK